MQYYFPVVESVHQQ